MLLDAPGLSAGSPMGFTLEMRVDKKGAVPFKAFTQDSADGEARTSWSDWFKEELATMGPDLNAGQAFPVVSFRFTAIGAGRTVTSEWLDYADSIDVDLTNEDDEPITKLEYLLGTPWGYRKGSSDDKGNVKESALPPGGSCLLGLKIAPVETNELPPNFFCVAVSRNNGRRDIDFHPQGIEPWTQPCGVQSIQPSPSNELQRIR
jgi:hypothetical protein